MLPFVFLFVRISFAGEGYIFTTSGYSVATVANKYDVVSTALSNASDVSAMKAIKPTLKTLFYRNALTYGSDYYVYDVNNPTKRIINRDWSWYLHDISNPAYRTALANYIKTQLDTNPQFDGVALDDVLSNLDARSFIGEGTSSAPTLPSDLVANWQSYMTALIQLVKSAVGSKLVILNCGWYATNYLALADGQEDEGFAHANWLTINDAYFSTRSWLNHTAALKAAVAAKKYYFVVDGVYDTPVPTEMRLNKLVRYVLASFLMVTDGGTYAKMYFCPSIYYKRNFWYPDYDKRLRLGNPVEDYSAVQGQTNVYKRSFQNGVVYVNPTDNPTTSMNLGGTYYTPENTVITALTLSAREGQLLFNSSASPAKPTGRRISP